MVRMIAIYIADSLQAQIVQTMCAAHRIDTLVLDPEVEVSQHLRAMQARGVELQMFVADWDALLHCGFSVLRLRAELKAKAIRGKVILCMPDRVAIDPLIERWATAEQGALLVIPAVNLGLRDDSVAPIARALAQSVGRSYEPRKTVQFLHGLNRAAFSNRQIARLHLETNRLASEGILVADILAWIDQPSAVPCATQQYRLKSYEECFSGTQLIEASAAHWQTTPERATELAIWLADAGFIYQVAGEPGFDEPEQLYRLSWPSEKLKPIRLLKALARMIDPIQGVTVADRNFRTRRYPQCFVGTEAVDWLRTTVGVGHADAVTFGRTLGNLRLVRHVYDEHYFVDQDYFYKFEHLDIVMHGVTASLAGATQKPASAPAEATALND